MWCEKHNCNVQDITQKETDNVILKIGKCNVGQEILIEKWRKVRANTIDGSILTDRGRLMYFINHNMEFVR